MLMFIGIGQGRVTSNLEGAPIDYAMVVSDDESVSMVCSTLYIIEYVICKYIKSDR